jgi:hypothetical protein
MRGLPAGMGPHHAAPILSGLVSIGRLGRAEALAAFIDASAAGAASCCLHGARSQAAVPLEPSHKQTSPRANAAKAARYALAPLLKQRAHRQILRTAVIQIARPHLSLAEIESLTSQAIARFLRTLPSARTKS